MAGVEWNLKLTAYPLKKNIILPIPSLWTTLPVWLTLHSPKVLNFGGAKSLRRIFIPHKPSNPLHKSTPVKQTTLRLSSFKLIITFFRQELTFLCFLKYGRFGLRQKNNRIGIIIQKFINGIVNPCNALVNLAKSSALLRMRLQSACMLNFSPNCSMAG